MLVIIALLSGSQMENIEKIFYMLDFNNDGLISLEEYGSVTSDIFLLANERKVSVSNQDHLTKLTYEEMDSNKDGKVDLKELLKAFKKHDYIIFQYLKDFVTMYSKIRIDLHQTNENNIELKKVYSTEPEPISINGYKPVNQEVENRDSRSKPQLERIPSVDGSGVISKEKMKFNPVNQEDEDATDEDYTTRHRRYRF